MGYSNSDYTGRISLPPVAFVMLIGGSIAGGAGGYGVLGPQLDRAALLSCTDNSKIAIGLVNEQSKDLGHLRQEIQNLRQQMHNEKSEFSKITTTIIIEQRIRDENQDRQINYLQREVDK